MKHHLTFAIDHSAYIRIFINRPFKKLYFTDLCIVTVHTPTICHILFTGHSTFTAIEDFYAILCLASRGELEAPANILSLGLQANEDLEQEDKLIEERDRLERLTGIDIPLPLTYFFWQKYSVWATSIINTWLYTRDGKIFLEANPDHGNRTAHPTEPLFYLSYQQFIQTYKVLFKFEISQATLSQWLKQTEDLMRIIHIYDKRFS